VIGAIERNLPNVADIIKTVERKLTGKITGTLALTNSKMQANQDGEANSALGKSGSMTGVSQMDGTQATGMGATSADLGLEEDDGGIKSKPVTVQKPFNLTKLRPKMIPVPDAIKREVVANPVPRGMFKKTLADIE
jgi:hypothetical protein